MKKVYFLFVFVVLGGIHSVAQVPFFQTYQLLRRKDPVQVNALLQGTQGFLWFGTTEGLFRFDGRAYERFTVNDSLRHNHVTALALDPKGKVWIGHVDGSISIYANGKITAFEPEEGTSSQAISDIHFDRTGTMWFGTLNDGLYYYKSGRVYRLDENEGMPDLYIYDIAEDLQGNVLAGTDGGIAVCTLRDNKVSIKTINYNNGLPDNIIRRIRPDENGKLWIATEDAGIGLYDMISGVYESPINGWISGPISDFILNDEYIWIACPQKGLLVLDKKSKTTQLVESNHVREIASVQVLLHDVEGNIWLGGKNGVARTPGMILQYFTHTKDAIDNNVLAVTQDRQERLWYSTNSGLFRRTISRNNVNASIDQPLLRTPYEHFTVISLFTDSAGYVWAGLYGEGALRIDPNNGKVKFFQSEISNGNVLNISGNGNEVWLATLGGSTKITIDGDQYSYQKYGRSEGLSSDFIYQVMTDSRGRTWFATDGKGVDMLDNYGIHHFENGLPSKIVYSIVEDGKGNIWVNVEGNGLYKLNDKNTFERGPNGLRENEIHCLARDNNGNLVVVHSAGIDLIDIAGGRIKYLGDEAGLRDKIANLNAVNRDQAGNLLFGTSSGIVRYTSGLHYFDRKPVPVISFAKIFDKVVSLARLKELSHDQDNLTFGFVGLWYQNPDHVFFTYKLENYDREWIQTRNPSVTYSQLPPGDYVFKLKVSATEDFADSRETSIAFMITPPFWRTPPFYMISAALLIIGGFGFMRFRERKLIQDKIVLEARVRRRTMEVQRQNDEIQAQNEEIMAQAEEIKGINENLELIVQERTSELERKNRALEEYAFINAHKLRSPVASILGLVNLISKTGLDEEGKEIAKRLKLSAAELDEIVRSITRAIEKGEEDTVQDDRPK